MKSSALILFAGLGISQARAAAPERSPAAAPSRSECFAAPRYAYDSTYLWSALALAERCAGSPELSERDRAQALLDAGRIRSRLGDYAGAEGAFKGVLRLAPDRAEAAHGLAAVLRERPEEALEHAERAVRDAKTPRLKASALFLSGQIRLDLGDPAGARESFDLALKAGGEDLDVLRALVRLTRERPREASDYASRAWLAAGSAPRWHRAAAYRRSASIWRELQDARRAADGYLCALELDPDDLDAMHALGALAGGLRRDPPGPCAPADGDKAWTEDAARRALGIEPGDLDALRALIAIKLGRGAKAEALDLAKRFLAAIESAPSYQWRDALLFAGNAFVELEEMDLALSAVTEHYELFSPSISLGALALEARTGPPRRERLEGDAPSLKEKRADLDRELARARSDLKEHLPARID